MRNADAFKALACLVNYDPETGKCVWRRREENCKKSKIFNANYAGIECGRLDNRGYRQICFRNNGNRCYIYSHRLAWFITYGVVPEGEIDHIDRDTSNNRIKNLRDVSRAINQRNAKMHAHNTSGVTGVYLDKKTRKWVAQAHVDKKHIHVGCFSSISEADVAIKTFRAKHGFTDNHGDSKTK